MCTCPNLGSILRKRVKEALAIAAYRTQTSYPIVDLLLCDDAPQFNALTVELALCWIHEYRHYKKLIPRFTHHCQLLQEFDKGFWKLYQGLLHYREHPNPAQAAALEAEFDQLFGQASGYTNWMSAKHAPSKSESSCGVRAFPSRNPLA